MSKPKKTKRKKPQAVYVLNTFTSGGSAVPHIGSKGWLCSDKDHNHFAGQVGRVCVVFRACFDPSTGEPRVPKGYMPVHLYFPLDHLSKRKIGIKRTALLRGQFKMALEEKRAKLAKESGQASKDLKKGFERLDKLLPETKNVVRDLWDKAGRKS